MIKFRRILLLLTVSLIVGSLVLCASAQSFDAKRTGSLEVHILDTKTKEGVPGGKVEIYRVAAVKAESGLFVFALTDDFRDSGFHTDALWDMTAAQNGEQAKDLAAYAAARNLSAADSAVPDQDGRAQFRDLSLGTHLVVQTKATSQRKTVAPFLITVPQIDGDSYIYDVDAAPKTGTSDPIPPTEPSRPGNGSNLPQTGQLWWPVYLMSAIGLACFLLGLYRRKRGTNG